MTDLSALYNSGKDLKAWDKANTPDDNLIYKNGMSSQIRKIDGVAAILPNYSQDKVYPPVVVGSHSSKSVGLPVSCFRFTQYGQVSAYAFIRDNFHDIKVVVVSDSPIHIPYHVIYREWSQEKYDQEKARYAGYPEDKIFLAVDGPVEGQERIDERQRLLASDTDDWYSEDWSSGTILRKDGRIYCTGSHQEVYCEGINKLDLPKATFKPYQDGMKSFVCEVGSYAIVAMIFEHVIASLEDERSKRNQERREREASAKSIYKQIGG